MRYLARRTGQAVIVLLAAFTGAFLLLQALPGDAIMIRYENPELGLSPQQIAEVRERFGVDTPLPVQYVHTLLGFFAGDFGYSLQTGTPVRQLLGEALPHTLTLGGIALVVAVLLAGLIAFGSSLPRLRWLRDVLRSLPPLVVSIPTFWLGIMLVQVVSFQLGWVSVIAPGPVEGLILPVITLAVPLSAPLAQILVRSIDDVSAQPFVAVVRARGASPAWILGRNVAKNAILPTLTMAGLLLGDLIGGAVLTETVFGRPGIGRITEQAVGLQDIPVLLAVVVLAAASFVVVNLIVDLLYPVLDPRLAARTREGVPA
ncbi:ABC transporter permease [Microbacterium sp. zg.Y1090]|uniref:ABC transporter permease n=1 Tax=Microbacterium TaxID=33882 RepID=UPI00214C8AAC|nr:MULTISPECIES: ABC transporter permease [unclassified Microbacterium]MCR2812392.1 ABC transporter permease [Microbacterium sp. zg.Y1084]MCR2817807.1 ABC transporter permease [Microbacterium sp. zg.Y1090]MDL5485549.1 ABC transporter permease [Microbacterium sp. zg-Y1211]WIM28720.1 ABC transporter permease [Microbacterium sp. zg-Y1090]